MLEIIKNMKFSCVNNKGFISAYFLVIFLYVITMITVLSDNLNYQAKTVENLKAIYAYQKAELTEIASLKTELRKAIALKAKYHGKDRSIHIQLSN